MQSDKSLTKHVTAAHHTLYKSKASRASAIRNAEMIEQMLPEFRKLLSLPDDVKIRLAGIRGSVNGRYQNARRLVTLDANLPRRKMIEVLAHELVHAEQYHTGKLIDEGYVRQWEGSVVPSKGTTYRAYRNLPWEVEAFERQSALADQVCVNVFGSDE